MRRILVKLLALGLALGTAFSSGAKTQEPEAPPMLATDPQAVKMLRRATSNGLETTTSFVQSQVAAPQQAQAPAPPAGAVSGNVDANGALQDTGEQLPGGGCPPGAPGGGACPGGSGAPATPTPAAGNTAAAPVGGRASPAAAGGAAAAANASPGKDGATGQTATEAVDAAGVSKSGQTLFDCLALGSLVPCLHVRTATDFFGDPRAVCVCERKKSSF